MSLSNHCHSFLFPPFGVVLIGRNWSTEEYRYGFQNQEIDKELWDGAVSYKYRIEDPRLGRFFSVDPLAAKYPWNSPFAFSENMLIHKRELEGLESGPVRGSRDNEKINGGSGGYILGSDHEIRIPIPKEKDLYLPPLDVNNPNEWPKYTFPEKNAPAEVQADISVGIKVKNIDIPLGEIPMEEDPTNNSFYRELPLFLNGTIKRGIATTRSVDDGNLNLGFTGQGRKYEMRQIALPPEPNEMFSWITSQTFLITAKEVTEGEILGLGVEITRIYTGMVIVSETNTMKNTIISNTHGQLYQVSKDTRYTFEPPLPDIEIGIFKFGIGLTLIGF